MPFKNVPPLYAAWVSMRWRCEKPQSKQFADYGGRGISVCERWLDYKTFEADMMPRPSLKHTIDRINNDKGYSPENCRWATRKEQQRNQRRAVYVTIEGKNYRAIELAEAAGLKTDTIIKRAKSGMTYEEVTSPIRRVVTEHLRHIGGKANGVARRAQTHCKAGHAYTDARTYVTKEGWRRCRECHRLKMQRLTAKKRDSQNPPPVS